MYKSHMMWTTGPLAMGGDNHIHGYRCAFDRRCLFQQIRLYLVRDPTGCFLIEVPPYGIVKHGH